MNFLWRGRVRVAFLVSVRNMCLLEFEFTGFKTNAIKILKGTKF